MITDLRIDDNGKTHTADAPEDYSTRELLDDILRSLHPGSNVHDWELRQGAAGRVLGLDLTLEENEVRSGDHLYLISPGKPKGSQPIVCGRCHTENSPLSRFCLACGTPLSPASPPVLPADETVDDQDLVMEVTSPQGESRRCVAPPDTLVSAFLSDLVKAFGLPQLDGTNRPIPYHLLRPDTGEKLTATKTLAESGIRSGQRLLMEAPRTQVPTPPPTP